MNSENPTHETRYFKSKNYLFSLKKYLFSQSVQTCLTSRGKYGFKGELFLKKIYNPEQGVMDIERWKYTKKG